MASSSHKRHKNQLEEVSNELGKKERGRDWLDLGLELGLGLDFSHGCKKQAHDQSYPVSVSVSVSKSTKLDSPPSPFLNHPDHQQIELGLGLGLGLGFGHEGFRSVNVAPPGNNHNTLWKDQDQDQDQDHNNGRDNHDMQLCPWQMDSSNRVDRQMPFFNDSNHYYTRRPHPGLWFTLLSSTNRDGAALPQIAKAYIRVKDENMTVFTVKKYLVRKLGLSNEAEQIDMSCMGQNLLQTLTLKQVRDVVWLPRLIQSVNSTAVVFQNPQDMSMPLHYGRRCLLDSTS